VGGVLVSRTTRSDRVRVTTCSECSASTVTGATGRPRVVCSARCAARRHARLQREAHAEHRREARAWWSALDWRGLLVVKGWLEVNPKPAGFVGSRKLWAYVNRRTTAPAFSAERMAS
jgi:hypothetical protein